MEINLVLTAKSWQLASQLQRTKPFGRVIMVKNVPERTYLAITVKQWQVLARFEQSHTVPEVLEAIISDRICPALGEFYELILKAVRARILVEPAQTVATVPAINWPLSVAPARLRYALWTLFAVGCGFSIALRPALPASTLDVAASLAALALAGALGAGLAASLLRGAGGEVYRWHGWLTRNTDARMLSPPEQRMVALAPLAMLATATGFLTWNRPGWSLLPLVGLLMLLRPILGGRVSRMIRVQASERLSDAEHDFIFPPNRTPSLRWRLLKAGLRSPTTWLEIGYGVLWTLLLGYFVGVLTDVPPWTLAFWQTQGPRLGVAVFGSLLLLGLIYVGLEFYVFARERALARRDTVRQWYGRWFGRGNHPTDESARLRAVLRSSLLRTLPPHVQQAFAKALKPQRHGPWHTLVGFDQPVAHVSLILSGKVGVYRMLESGRRVLLQTLCEDDLVGLHTAADPEYPRFLYRTLTPVLLLQLDWAQAQEFILSRVPPLTLVNHIEKLPFLARISLCQNWHLQAVQRFAELSRIANFAEGEVILQRGFFSDSFYIIFEGEARIVSEGKVQGMVRASNFFGEIGLLQNSNTMAQVVAGPGTRCLCIPRREFLRFVAHNYTVALKLERVSSQRLGRPIFPLTPGNFQQI
jgi:CRP-like cAMP-binding protein